MGTLCNARYMPQEFIDSLKPGDVVQVPRHCLAQAYYHRTINNRPELKGKIRFLNDFQTAEEGQVVIQYVPPTSI